MRASSASGCKEAAIDQSESPGATVSESGRARSCAAGASCVGVGSATGAVCVASWSGSGVLGLSPHVSETVGEVWSSGDAREAAAGAPVTSAEPISALAPARASRERERWVPQRETKKRAARRAAGGATRRSARWAHAVRAQRRREVEQIEGVEEAERGADEPEERVGEVRLACIGQ